MPAVASCSPLCALIAGIAAQEAGAWEALLRRMGTELLRQAESVCGCPALAQDAVQEAWLGIARRAATFRPQPPDPDAAAGAWLRSQVRNAARNLLRAERRRERRQEQAARVPGASAPTAIGERSLALRHCLDRLPPAQRQILHLRYWQEWDHDRIGAHLGCTAATARVRLHRAQRRLRSQLSVCALAVAVILAVMPLLLNGPGQSAMLPLATLCFDGGRVDLDRGTVSLTANGERLQHAGPLALDGAPALLEDADGAVWSLHLRRTDERRVALILAGADRTRHLLAQPCRQPGRPLPAWLRERMR